MNFNDGTTQLDLNKDKTSVNASHESSLITEAENEGKDHLDKIAMESAKRAQHRIHSDEQDSPDSTLFTK